MERKNLFAESEVFVVDAEVNFLQNGFLGVFFSVCVSEFSSYCVLEFFPRFIVFPFRFVEDPVSFPNISTS